MDITDSLEDGFLRYSLSVIKSRAIPDVRDGLKPVQRRILWSLWEQGSRPSGSFRKSARVVGDCMGKYHPHGDAAIYDALARMAQPHSMRVPLVDGHGNFGSLDDPPAAARYTECRISEYGHTMMEGIDLGTVRLRPNFDGSEREPEAVPAPMPNLLVNGAQGIAVGVSTSVPPHNPDEVIDACLLLLDDPDADWDGIRRVLPGPDFPGGGMIVDLDGVWEAYRSGKGSFRVRGVAKAAHVGRNRQALEVTELPPMVGPERFISRVKSLLEQGRLQTVSDAVDYSDRNQGMRILVELRPGADPAEALDELCRLTPLEETFHVSLCVLDGIRPVTMDLRQLLLRYLDHRVEVVTARSRCLLEKVSEQLHLLEGSVKVAQSLPSVLEILSKARSEESARRRLMRELGLSDRQASAVLEAPLRRLLASEKGKLLRRVRELDEERERLERVLSSNEEARRQVRDELLALKGRFGGPRRTRLGDCAASPADVVLLGWGFDGVLAPPEPGVGYRALLTVEGGTVAAVTASGQLVETSVSSGSPDDAVALLPSSAVEGEVTVVTAAGRAKRVARPSPGRLITLETGDRAVAAFQDTGWMLVVTESGRAVRMPSNEIPVQGPQARGVKAVRLAAGDKVVWAGPARRGSRVWALTDAGRLAGADAEEVPPRTRGSVGVRLFPDRLGRVVDVADPGEGVRLAVRGPRGGWRVSGAEKTRNPTAVGVAL